MEVMGLMLGEFVDDYTVRVVDVFAMPQSGTGVSVEAVDPVFQTKMLDMLKQTGRLVSRENSLCLRAVLGAVRVFLVCLVPCFLCFPLRYPFRSSLFASFLLSLLSFADLKL